MNVINYSRVSTDEQATHGYSLEDQQEKLPQFCERNGHEIVLNVDDNVSAKTFDRPGWKQIMDYIKKNRNSVDLILIMRWNRFSRNAPQALGMLEELKKYNVGVNAIEQWIDFSVPQNKYMLAIYLTEAEVDNDMRSKLVKEGMQKGKLSGRYLGRAPRGYLNITDEKRKPLLVIDEKKAPYVRELFEMFATGLHSQRALVKYFNQKGFKLDKTQLSKILRNITYCGKLLVKPIKDEPLQIVDGFHDPIISEELFNKVQSILYGRQTQKNQRKPKQKNENYPLRGFLQCTKCEGKMTASKSRGNGGDYHYYHCNTCGERHSIHPINEQMIEMLNAIQFNDEAKELYMEIVKELMKGSDDDRKSEIKRNDAEIEKNEKRLHVLLDEKLDQNITQTEYIAGKKRYETIINNLKLKNLELNSIKTEFDEYFDWGLNLLSNVKEYYQNTDIQVKQQIIGSIYPEFLYIEETKLRTTRINEVVGLIASINGGLGENKKGQIIKKNELSLNVPRAGLEPARPQRSQDFKSCVSTNSTIRASKKNLSAN
jgi:site-specific DNA recombinase